MHLTKLAFKTEGYKEALIYDSITKTQSQKKFSEETTIPQLHSVDTSHENIKTLPMNSFII